MNEHGEPKEDLVPVKHKPDSTGEQFRRDGEAAVAWVADYLERVRELPVQARVKPGEIRRKLPPSPPARGEPFADVLADLDELLDVLGLQFIDVHRHDGYREPRIGDAAMAGNGIGDERGRADGRGGDRP